MNLKQKARIALSAIAIFAAVGGAFAVKSKFSGITYYKATTSTIYGSVTVLNGDVTNTGLSTYWTTTTNGYATNFGRITSLPE